MKDTFRVSHIGWISRLIWGPSGRPDAPVLVNGELSDRYLNGLDTSLRSMFETEIAKPTGFDMTPSPRTDSSEQVTVTRSQMRALRKLADAEGTTPDALVQVLIGNLLDPVGEDIPTAPRNTTERARTANDYLRLLAS